jgi:hypothetical protein
MPRSPRHRKSSSLAALSEKGTEQLFHGLLKGLAGDTLPSLKGNEGEVAYTSRALVPLIQGFLDRLSISGFLLGGHHTGINRPIRYLGMDFHPDLAVFEGERRLLALEVKFLTGRGRSTAFTTALGQTLAYRNGGYLAAAALIIDRNNLTTASQLRAAREKSGVPGRMATVFRAAKGRKVTSGEIFYPSAATD